MHRPNDKGMALSIVIVVIIMLALIAGYAAQLGYNQRRLTDISGGRRAKVYFLAQAGVIDANWRIRNNYTVGLSPVGSFTNDNYNPNAYSVDVNNDGTNDVTVDIGAVTNALTKQRSISSTGLDT